MRNNRERYKALEPRYKQFWVGATCYYCGDKADTTDHVPAISVAYAMGAEALEKQGAPFVKVSACRECNVILSDEAVLSLEARGKYIYEYLLRRYGRFLDGRRYEYLEELEEFGPNLRSYIENHANVTTWIERRLCFIENVFTV